MKSTLAITALLASFATPAHAALLDCRGYQLIDSTGSNLQYQVIVNRRAFDLRGTPVSVTVFQQFNTNTAQPAHAVPVLQDSPGQLTRNEHGETVVAFKGGLLEVRPGNSGFTGLRHALDGKLVLNGRKAVSISCPLNDEQ